MPPSTPDPDDAAFREALEQAAADPDVLGAILVGSRAIGDPFVRDGSDWDLRLIVRDDAVDAAHARLATPHGSRVETAVMRHSTFESLADPGSPAAWDRPSYAFAQLLLDRLDGGIERTLHRLAALDQETARAVAAAALDDYVNSYFRSIKNAAIGQAVGARFDAAESIGPLLTFLFALRGRVRPFNRHLAWALEREPLGDGWLATQPLLARLEALLTTGDATAQASLFRDVEALARAEGFGLVIDGWEPDVARLRAGR